MSNQSTKKRIIYVSGGPANLIAAHESWKQATHHASEVSMTFSGQIQQACQDLGYPMLMTSIRGPVEQKTDGLFTILHTDKKRYSGLLFHIKELTYVLHLLRQALKFKADVALVDSGASHFFLFSIFKLLGIKVVPILHNTLWAKGFYPIKPVQKTIMSLDKYLFWRRTPTAVISVSPECERQAKTLAPKLKYPTYQTRAQFIPSYFEQIQPISFPKNDEPFHIMFIGRVERMKGVFDILDMAEYVNARVPNKVKWTICGRGIHLDELKAAHAKKGLQDSVELAGWVGLDELIEIYNRTHCCIVPTRSDFTEGLAMTAVEAILAGRPVISNPVVPATELLAPACLLGNTNDYASHAEQAVNIATDEALYQKLSAACSGLGDAFLDRENGLTAVTKKVLTEHC